MYILFSWSSAILVTQSLLERPEIPAIAFCHLRIQSGSLAFKSVNSSYAPEIHLTQRTGAGSQATRFKIDSSGNIYVADNANHQIRKIDSSGNVTTLGGQIGEEQEFLIGVGELIIF